MASFASSATAGGARKPPGPNFFDSKYVWDVQTFCEEDFEFSVILWHVSRKFAVVLKKKITRCYARILLKICCEKSNSQKGSKLYAPLTFGLVSSCYKRLYLQFIFKQVCSRLEII